MKKRINIIHQNVQRISNKLPEIEVFLDDNNCDIFCVNEHQANEGQVRSINIDGYSLVSCYCRNTFRHGGTGIQVRNDTETCELDYIKDISEDKHFECVGQKCNINPKQSLLILSLYRSPDGNINIFLTKMEEAVQLLVKK